MRLGSLTVSATLSAVLLSGCSFIGGSAGPFKNPFAKQKAASHAQYGTYNSASAGQRCQIYSPAQPIPQGCRPEQVTLATGRPGGFAQEPNFGEPSYAQYTDGAYGSAVGQHPSLAHHTAAPKKRKPKLRGSLSLGLERSVSGSLIDYDRFSLDPIGTYNPQDFNEGSRTGSDATGDEVRTTFTANRRNPIGSPFVPATDSTPAIPADPGFFDDNEYDQVNAPQISFDDAWSTPTRISGGLEYIANDRTTFFANAGYSHSEGNDGTAASIQATLFRVEEAGQYITTPAVAGTAEIPAVFDTDGVTILTPAIPAVAGTPETITRTGTLTTASFVPNEEIAQFSYDFSDLRRIDLEAGARHYFKPIVKSQGFRTITPFVGASAGASHYSEASVKVSQRQRFFERGFDLGGGEITEDTPEQFYDVVTRNADDTTNNIPIAIFDSQWVPSGQINVGAEWQVTPGTALALESGVRIEGARKYSNGIRGDANISIPVTLRGSFNF